MEIIHLQNNIYQVVDLASDSVIVQGTHDECVSWLANFERMEEEALYSQFLRMAGF